MDEDQRPVERETTVIQTGERSGGGGAVAAIVALVVLAVIAFLFFGGYLERAADEVDVNVNVETPKVELPDVTIETPPPEPSAPANSN
jgi:hypothetical protein